MNKNKTSSDQAGQPAGAIPPEDCGCDFAYAGGHEPSCKYSSENFPDADKSAAPAGGIVAPQPQLDIDALIEQALADYKRGRSIFSYSDEQSVRIALRMGINVGLKQVAAIADRPQPSTAADVATLVDLHKEAAPTRVAAFLRLYAGRIRHQEHWDVPETMAAAYESAARALDDYMQQAAALADRPARPHQDTGVLSDTELLNTMDGVVWAREFCRVTGFADEEWAVGWFCNAIMAGYDEANRRRDKAAEAAGLALRGRLQPLIETWRQAAKDFGANPFSDAHCLRVCADQLDQALAEPPEQG